MIMDLSLRLLRLFAPRKWIPILDAHWNLLRNFLKCLGLICGYSGLIHLRTSLSTGIHKTYQVILMPAKVKNLWSNVSNDLLNCLPYCLLSTFILLVDSDVFDDISHIFCWKVPSLDLCDTLSFWSFSDISRPPLFFCPLFQMQLFLWVSCLALFIWNCMYSPWIIFSTPTASGTIYL